METGLDTIQLGSRHRKDLGNLDGLAESIAECGLMHPIVVTPDNVLIAGERRLEACRLLGWETVPVTVVDLADVVRGEHDENAQRKDFAPSEIDAIRRALEPMQREAASERRAANSPNAKVSHSEKEQGRTVDKIGAFAGVSGRTVEKIAKVVDAAEADPERFGHLVEQMDKNGKVDRAYKELKTEQRKVETAKAAETVPSVTDRYKLHHAPCIDALELDAGSVDVIITDPPYPREFLDVYADLSDVAAHVLKPGGLAVVMCGQTFLPEVMERLGRHLQYHWCAAYLTPGGQAVQQFPRKVNAFWKPLLVYSNGEYGGDWFGDVIKSDPNDNDKNHHHWGQSLSGMRDIVSRFVKPGNMVLDPFLGGGATAVTALEAGASFIGYDISGDCITTTRGRIGEMNASVCE